MTKVDVLKFVLGQIVYHKCKPDEAGIVTGVFYRENSVSYGVTWSDHCERGHAEFELTSEKSLTIDK